MIISSLCLSLLIKSNTLSFLLYFGFKFALYDLLYRLQIEIYHN